jgi:galactonate dehydratase
MPDVRPIIERIELCAHRASARSTWTMVRVVSDAGLAGVGECSDTGDSAVLNAAVDAARAALLGEPVDGDRTALRTWLCRRRQGADRSTGFAWSTALGGLEAALEDLTARHAGLTLAEHLGTAPPGRVGLYANLNRTWGDRGLGELVTAARSAADEGFPAVKIAPFGGAAVGGADDVVPAGLAVIDAVRDVLPSETALMVDCHFRLDDRALRAVLPELADRRVFWLEDAVHPGDLDRLGRLREQTSLPLAAGEHEWDPGVVEAACATGAFDFWLIDPKHAGGPNATQQLLEVTGSAAVSFHNPSGPVGTVHAAHLSGLSPRVTWLEYAWGEPARVGFLCPAEQVENGMLVVPDGPGIGVSLAMDDMAEQAVGQ